MALVRSSHHAAMWAVAVLLFSILLATAQAASANKRSLGPLGVMNHHPLYVGLLYPAPEDARLAESMVWGLSITHSNVYIKSWKEQWSVDIDKELTQASFTLRAPIRGWKLEAGLEAPVYFSSSGFLDKWVREWHNITGLPGYVGQDRFPDFSYSDETYYDSKILAKGRRNELLPGDITIWLKGNLNKAEGRVFALQIFAQAPTGRAEHGTGSGEWELGARWLGTIGLDPVIVHMGGGFYMPGALARPAYDKRLNNFMAGFAGVEYRWSERLSLIAQSMFNTSPHVDEGPLQYRMPWMEASFGVKYRLESGKVVSLGFSENLNRTAPDFSLHIALTSQ